MSRKTMGTGQLRQRLLSAKEAADYLGIAPKTLWEWVNEGLIRQVRLKGRKPKYDLRDLDNLIEDNKHYAEAAVVFGKAFDN